MKNNTKKTLSIYWQHTKGLRLQLAAITIAVIGATVIGSIIPLYFKRFFDTLSSSTDKIVVGEQLIHILYIVLAFEIGRWLLWRISAFINSHFQSVVIAKLSDTSFKYLHKHSFTFFNNNFVGSLVKRLNWFTRAFESVYDKIIWNIIPLIVNIAAIEFVLFRRNHLLGIGLLIWVVVFMIVNWLLIRYKLPFDIKRSEAESSSTALLADTITNNSNVKLFVGYNREVNSFKKIADEVRLLRRFTWNLDGIFDGAQAFLTISLEIGFFLLAIKLWHNGSLTVGDFVLIQTYMVMIFNEIWGFGRVIRFLYADLADAEEMTAVLTTPHEIIDTKQASELQVKRGGIIFEDVDFNYNKTRKVISQLNVDIKPQEKIALVGPSGAGKTTIIKLLLRMHEITGGKIIIDGQPITNVTQASLWSAISLVPQDPILFHRTLLENIRYGKPDATDEEVERAAKLAHCHEFINEFPDKYKTFVGERGVKLSGGERQRIAIARAILRNAPIIVLDEATSSLDSESEALIQDALTSLMKNKTVIVIAHRLSTIMKMDRIMVIDQGKIVEEGSHDVLLKRPHGLYKQLWKLQAGGFMPDSPTTNQL